MPSWTCSGVALVALLVALSSAGCKQANWAPVSNTASHGRYLGVGIYGPGKSCTRIVANQTPNSDVVARPIDDQVIIVVADSLTGELRACGDLTGYCIGMNPWNKQLLSTQIAPIDLTGHAQPEAPDMTVEVGAPKRPRRHPYTPAASPHAPRATASAVS
jgi:hypothetical protein